MYFFIMPKDRFIGVQGQHRPSENLIVFFKPDDNELYLDYMIVFYQ